MVTIEKTFPYISKTNHNDNKEISTIIWLNPKISIFSRFKQAKKQLQLINDHVVIYSELESCISFIETSEKEVIYLIISGIDTAQMLLRIHKLIQIESIFLFNFDEIQVHSLVNDYPKIINIYDNFDVLCVDIEKQIQLNSKQLKIQIFPNPSQSILEGFSSFHFLNEIIKYFPQINQEKSHFIQHLRQYYRNNSHQQKLIDDFEKSYQSNEAIRWYIHRSFISKLINKALWTLDIDELYNLRFYLRDLSENLARESQQSNQSLTLFRASCLLTNEINGIKKAIGQYFSINSYMFANRIRSFALAYITKRIERKDHTPALMEIECNMEDNDGSIILADISKYSKNAEENQFMFDLGTIFRLNDVSYDGDICVMKISLSNGRQAMIDKYIEHIRHDNESIGKTIGRLLDQFGNNEQSKKYLEYISYGNDSLNCYISQYNIGRNHYEKQEFNVAREYYDRAYHLIMNTYPIPPAQDLSNVLSSIGNLVYRQKKYEEALNFFNQALKIREEHYRPEDKDLIRNLDDIALMLSKLKRNQEALVYYQRAFALREKYYPSERLDIAISLTFLGSIYTELGKYDQSLEYHQHALDIRKEYGLSNRHHQIFIANSLDGIGTVYHRQKKFKEAIDYYRQALKIKEEICPSNHSELAQSFNNIALLQTDLSNYDDALELFTKALQINEKLYPTGDILVASTMTNIGIVLHRQGNYTQAIEIYKNSRQMLEKLYPKGHINIALNLYNTALILYNQMKYSEALKYHHQALNIRKELTPLN
ncbi:hypothetical protein I4U23_019845 [Adineta vaga]|nr:hypothetical protein I4U23_019845 [Adineta vaga]